MKEYRIIGKYNSYDECDCEYCSGHKSTEYVDEVVSAETEKEALKIIVNKYSEWDDKLDWRGKPDIQDVTKTETQLMMEFPRKIAPVMPGFEKAIPEFYR